MTQPETPLDIWARTPFSDQFEMSEAIRSPRYKQSDAFRAAVAAKIDISQGLGVDQIRVGGVEQSIAIGTGSLTGESSSVQDQKAIEREYAASRSDAPLDVNPNAIQ